MSPAPLSPDATLDDIFGVSHSVSNYRLARAIGSNVPAAFAVASELQPLLTRALADTPVSALLQSALSARNEIETLLHPEWALPAPSLTATRAYRSTVNCGASHWTIDALATVTFTFGSLTLKPLSGHQLRVEATSVQVVGNLVVEQSLVVSGIAHDYGNYSQVMESAPRPERWPSTDTEPSRRDPGVF